MISLALLRTGCLVSLLVFGAGAARAQQDPAYTQYMFNALAFNPAYAGTAEYWSATALAREQWLSWGTGGDRGGAPRTYAVNAHAPFAKRAGAGGSLSYDRVGASVFARVAASYAYRLPLAENRTLSLGLRAGLTQHRYDVDELDFRDDPSGDPAFAGASGASSSPSAGAGVYFYTDRFYLGASAPRLFEAAPPGPSGRPYRHLYVVSGAALPLERADVIVKPSLVLTGVGWLSNFATSRRDVGRVATPTLLELDASLLFQRTFWVGASYRTTLDYLVARASSQASAGVWGGIQLGAGLRLGVAYDYPLTALAQFGGGSAEVMLGFDANFTEKRMSTPRYF